MHWLVKPKLEQLDEPTWLRKYLLKKGYQNYGNQFTKDFTIIDMSDSCGVIKNVTIGHTICKQNTFINKDVLITAIIAENYYSRI